MKQFLFFLIMVSALADGRAQILPGDTETEFPGGMTAFYEFVSDNIQYPKQAQKNSISGIVFIEFYISQSGFVNKDSVRIVPASEIREVAGDELADQVTSNKFLEREALRVIKKSPRWIPGKESGRPIAQKIVFPVSFDKDLFKKKPVKNKPRMAVLNSSFFLHHA